MCMGMERTYDKEHDPPHFESLIFPYLNGRIAWMGGLQHGAIPLQEQALDQKSGIKLSNNNTAMSSWHRTIHNQQILVKDPGPPHRVSLHSHKKGRFRVGKKEIIQGQRSLPPDLRRRWESCRLSA